MECKTEKKVRVHLVLDLTEAKWLRDIMQNPIGCTKEDEGPAECRMREKFFNALEAIDDQIT